MSRKRFKKEEATTYIIPTFKNELYQLSNESGPTVLPLLFDFFNLTSQPMHIWNSLDQQKTDSVLFKEAFHLFMSHNSLYGAFMIHSQLKLANITTTKTTTTITPATILVYCILSITFYSAHQSLPDNNNSSFYTFAHLFYKKAHKAFIESCFPTQPPPVDTKEEEYNHIYLVQASVLLAHFQCQAIDENQAYMTTRIGLDLTQRYAIIDLVPKYKKLVVFLKVLKAWHVWLSLYLNKPYHKQELDLSLLTTTTQLTTEQFWAVKVTEIYTILLERVLLKELTTIDTIKVKKNCYNNPWGLTNIYKGKFEVCIR